jgi:hypothetical protein
MAGLIEAGHYLSLPKATPDPLSNLVHKIYHQLGHHL